MQTVNACQRRRQLQPRLIAKPRAAQPFAGFQRVMDIMFTSAISSCHTSGNSPFVTPISATATVPGTPSATVASTSGGCARGSAQGGGACRQNLASSAAAASRGSCRRYLRSAAGGTQVVSLRIWRAAGARAVVCASICDVRIEDVSEGAVASC